MQLHWQAREVLPLSRYRWPSESMTHFAPYFHQAGAAEESQGV
jgi:hypothetical protein